MIFLKKDPKMTVAKAVNVSLGAMKPPRKENETMHRYPFIVDIPADEYHEAARRGEFLSSHLLGDFGACPRLYRKKMSGEIEPTDTAAYQTGRALHTLILEGRAKFDAEYLISSGPTNPKTGEPFGKTTKAYREWLASQKRPIVSSEDFGWMLKLQQSIALHPVANALLEHGRAEGTVRIALNGEPCQIRMDWFNPDFEGRPDIVDLKTCENLSFFERTPASTDTRSSSRSTARCSRRLPTASRPTRTSSDSRRANPTAAACGNSPTGCSTSLRPPTRWRCRS